MAFRVEYRCFNCVSVCPADGLEAFHGDKTERRRVLDEQVKPLTHERRARDQQFVIDTPSARRRHGIPPGEWRSPPGDGPDVRLVELERVRSSSIDAVMRNLTQMFRAEEADGLDFSVQFDFRGDDGGLWWMLVGDGRCQVGGGTIEAPELVVRCPGALFVAISRGRASVPLALLRRQLRLEGRRGLFLHFPRLFGATPSHGILARLLWWLRR